MKGTSQTTFQKYTIGPFHNLCAHAHNCFRQAKQHRRIVNKDSPTNVSIERLTITTVYICCQTVAANLVMKFNEHSFTFSLVLRLT